MSKFEDLNKKYIVNDDYSGLLFFISCYSFKETLERLKLFIKNAKLHLFCEIDHAQLAHDVNLHLRPTGCYYLEILKRGRFLWKLLLL